MKHHRSLFGLGRDTSIKSDGVKRVVWVKTSHCSEMIKDRKEIIKISQNKKDK
jgi:hypothetical protein